MICKMNTMNLINVNGQSNTKLSLLSDIAGFTGENCLQTPPNISIIPDTHCDCHRHHDFNSDMIINAL